MKDKESVILNLILKWELTDIHLTRPMLPIVLVDGWYGGSDDQKTLQRGEDAK